MQLWTFVSYDDIVDVRLFRSNCGCL
jgi:hypothetical protein